MKKLFGFIGVALIFSPSSRAFPNICDVVKQPSFRSCLELEVQPTVCGDVAPRPCAHISYYVPQTFIETTTSEGISHFSDLPGAALQLKATRSGSYGTSPYGVVSDDDTQSFHARTIAIPLAQVAFSGLPCGGTRQEKLCFDGMSEHLGSHWLTGSGDLWQPAFLAWKLNPKSCLLKGAITSVMGTRAVSLGSSMCSTPLSILKKFPPSQMPVCTGWGVMFPRYGTYIGGSELIGALTIAGRIKSLSVEVFRSLPSSLDERWSMVSPNSSQCFIEFENIALVEGFKWANNRGRLLAKNLNGNIFVIWKKVSCTVDWVEIPVYRAKLGIMEQVCKGDIK